MDRVMISAMTVCADGEGFYLIDIATGFLFRYEYNTLSYQVVSYHPLPEQDVWVQIINIFQYNDALYFVYLFSRNIVRFDLTSKHSEVFGNDQYDNSEIKNTRACLCGKQIWIFPYKVSDSVLIFDIDKNEFTSEMCISSFLPNFICKKAFFSRKYFLKDTVWMTFRGLSDIYAFDIKSNVMKAYPLSIGTQGEDVFYGDNRFWIVNGKQGDIKSWNVQDINAETYQFQPINDDEDKPAVYDLLCDEERLIIIPRQGKGISVINRGSGQETFLAYPEDLERTFNPKRSYFGICVPYGNRILMIPHSVDRFLWLDLKKGTLESCKAYLKEDEVSLLHCMHQETLLESDDIRLKSYVRYIAEVMR